MGVKRCILQTLQWIMLYEYTALHCTPINWDWIIVRQICPASQTFHFVRPPDQAESWYSYMRVCVCLSVCLCVCSLREVPFNGLFAPTSWSRMSNIFRDSESLGKSNGKKWSQIWTFWFGSGLKSPCNYYYFFCWFCLTKHGGNHAFRWIRDLLLKGISLILAYL